MATCPDCNEPLYDGKHECGNKPHMFKISLDLFRIPETFQRLREWWWLWRNKWGSGSGNGPTSSGVTP